MGTDALRPTKSNCKLSSEERRAAILRAVRRVFSQKGFDGTTTRELADAAGVSEALLFKHFPNKEALFSAMKLSLNQQDLGRLERITGLEASVSTLVLMVHFLTSRVIEGWSTCEDEPAIQHRLMLRSLAQDGEVCAALAAATLRSMGTESLRMHPHRRRIRRGLRRAGLPEPGRVVHAPPGPDGDDGAASPEPRR